MMINHPLVFLLDWVMIVLDMMLDLDVIIYLYQIIILIPVSMMIDQLLVFLLDGVMIVLDVLFYLDVTIYLYQIMILHNITIDQLLVFHLEGVMIVLEQIVIQTRLHSPSLRGLNLWKVQMIPLHYQLVLLSNF